MYCFYRWIDGKSLGFYNMINIIINYILTNEFLKKLVSYIKNNLNIIYMSDIEKRIEERELSKKKYYIIRKLNNISGNLELLKHELEHEQTLEYHDLLKQEIEFYKIKLYEYSEVYFHLINKIK